MIDFCGIRLTSRFGCCGRPSCFGCHQCPFCFLVRFLAPDISGGTDQGSSTRLWPLSRVSWVAARLSGADAECKHGPSSLASHPELPQGPRRTAQPPRRGREAKKTMRRVAVALLCSTATALVALGATSAIRTTTSLRATAQNPVGRRVQVHAFADAL